MVCITHPLTDICVVCTLATVNIYVHGVACISVPVLWGTYPYMKVLGHMIILLSYFFFDNSFKLFFNIIYFLLCWVFIAVLMLSLVVGSRGYSLAEVLGLLLS